MKNENLIIDSAQSIRALLKSFDDSLVVAVLHTGASYLDVLKALNWLEHDNFSDAELMAHIGAKAYSVYEILQSERDQQEDEG